MNSSNNASQNSTALKKTLILKSISRNLRTKKKSKRHMLINLTIMTGMRKSERSKKCAEFKLTNCNAMQDSWKNGFKKVSTTGR